MDLDIGGRIVGPQIPNHPIYVKVTISAYGAVGPGDFMRARFLDVGTGQAFLDFRSGGTPGWPAPSAIESERREFTILALPSALPRIRVEVSFDVQQRNAFLQVGIDTQVYGLLTNDDPGRFCAATNGGEIRPRTSFGFYPGEFRIGKEGSPGFVILGLPDLLATPIYLFGSPCPLQVDPWIAISGTARLLVPPSAPYPLRGQVQILDPGNLNFSTSYELLLNWYPPAH